jgi:HlyD family secretion protein
VAFFLIFAITGCTECMRKPRQQFGEVEVSEIDLASRVPSRVAKIHVKLGQKVKAGDLLVELQGDVIEAQKQRAKAAIEAARNQRDIAKDAVRKEELLQLKANLSAAEKQRDFAQNALARMQELLKEGAISQQKFEEAETTAHGAGEKYLAALAQYKLGLEGARKESKQAAEALLSQAESGLTEVSAYEKDLALRAPVDGEVFALPHEVGELVPQGYPVVTLIAMNEPWVVVQIPEDQLKDFSMEKKVRVGVPALGGREVETKVSYIAAMPSYATLVYTEQKSSFDLKTFEVRLTPLALVDGLRPGMTVQLKN